MQTSLHENTTRHWYFSNANTRQYHNWASRAMDWLGRKLSFLNDEEARALSQKKPSTPTLKSRIWGSGIGYLVGGVGALLRWGASRLAGKRFSADTYQKSNMLIHNKDAKQWIKKAKQQQLAPKDKISLISLNVATFPTYLEWINRKFLKPNNQRVPNIIERLNKLDHDVIALQEAFSPEAQAKLIQGLKAKYPYYISAVGKGFNGLNLTKPFGWVVGSGLMLFSKYPIVETDFQVYSNTAIGEESGANKGFLACKILLPGNRFSTVYNTHTQSGGMWPFRGLQTKLGGSTNERRGVELNQINEHMKKWEAIPPPIEGLETAIHTTTHMLGDINTAVNNEKTMLSQCVYTHAGKDKKIGDILSPGKEKLFARMFKKAPDNLADIRPDFLINGTQPPPLRNIELYSSLDDWRNRSSATKASANHKLQLLVHKKVAEEFNQNGHKDINFSVWDTIDIRKLIAAQKKNERALNPVTHQVDKSKLQFSGTGPKDEELIAANSNPNVRVPSISPFFNTRVMDCNVVSSASIDPHLSGANIRSQIVSFENNTDHFGVATTVDLRPIMK